MFEISWSEILVIGIVALIVVGPKELPVLLRTVGRYMGIIKRQASEFRAQFDEAMRDSELEQLKKDVESIKTDAENTLRDAERSVETEMSDARREFETVGDSVKADSVHETATIAHDANGLPMEHPALAPAEIAHESSPPASGAGSAAIAAAAAAAATVPHEPAPREPAKTGA